MVSLVWNVVEKSCVITEMHRYSLVNYNSEIHVPHIWLLVGTLVMRPAGNENKGAMKLRVDFKQKHSGNQCLHLFKVM